MTTNTFDYFQLVASANRVKFGKKFLRDWKKNKPTQLILPGGSRESPGSAVNTMTYEANSMSKSTIRDLVKFMVQQSRKYTPENLLNVENYAVVPEEFKEATRILRESHIRLEGSLWDK